MLFIDVINNYSSKKVVVLYDYYLASPIKLSVIHNLFDRYVAVKLGLFPFRLSAVQACRGSVVIGTR